MYNDLRNVPPNIYHKYAASRKTVYTRDLNSTHAVVCKINSHILIAVIDRRESTLIMNAWEK